MASIDTETPELELPEPAETAEAGNPLPFFAVKQRI